MKYSRNYGELRLGSELDRKEKNRAGRPGRAAVGITKDGRAFHYSSTYDAARAVGATDRTVYNCCMRNAALETDGAGRLKTDYSAHGMRWYFADNYIWKTKIKKP